jgi:solute carrier family 25 uncoupling protein 8/9
MKGFYRGIEPNIARNTLMNVGEMASYDQIKQLLLHYTRIPDSMPLHFICGFAAGFIATIIASPVDVLKTRLMSNPDAYTGVVNCFTRTLREEGVFAFYKGFVPNFTRVGSWAVVCFVGMEQFKRLLIHPDDIKGSGH